MTDPLFASEVARLYGVTEAWLRWRSELRLEVA